jgi:Domain of unknown function (DUF4375)
MPDTLAAVLSAEDDATLCKDLFALLLAHHGEGFDPAVIPAEHRTVLLVWHTQSVIGGRGFNGFFSADMPGDPDYRHMRAAYEAVGCEPAAAAVRRVFSAFPGGNAPADTRARVRAFGKANHEVHGALNRDFIKAQESLTAALAKHIRNHGAAFKGIDQAVAARNVGSPPALHPPKPDPIEVAAADLPRWARAAFYARCARQVFPLWEEAWPDSPVDFHNAIEQTIVLAEMCAAEAKPVGDLKAASGHARRVAEGAVAAESGDNATGPPPAHATRAGLIAAAAGSVIDFITDEDDTGSYAFAKGIVEDADRDDLMEDIQDDFQRIRQLARDYQWNDKTPVPPEVFDPTYKPSGKWWKVW